MAKWYGIVGFVIPETEVEPGIWNSNVTEQEFYGDTLSHVTKWSSAGKVNDDLTVSNKISIMSTPFANVNSQFIKYVEFMGALWNVTMIDPQPPRLILTIGGVYNGDSSRVTE